MDAHRYRFRTTWRLAAPPDRVYAVLAEPDAYPQWWPNVRSTRRLDEESGEVRCRGLLPVDLTFVIHREVEDPIARVIRVTMTGDVNGVSEWTIGPDGRDGRTIAVFTEDLTIGKGLVRAAGRLARPVLRVNHDLMMRAGEHGLRRRLAATPRS